ncbi:MAG TPA: D-arabinono-1,4-lactone oxidase, partial [Pyrinomonadaceae bacterium]
LYALTCGRFIWLEGRVRGGVFRNWCRRYRHRPARFAAPRTEEEIVSLVKNSGGAVRFFGAGHSFNEGVVAEGQTLASLDNYAGLLWRDLTKLQAAFKGGTRVRDISRALFERGLAIGALPSHDAQSIAGIISTDVHGTGRDWGFVSEWVAAIKLVDGEGVVHTLAPEDELFKAAIGGIGGVGVITEVVLRAVPRFNIDQRVEMSTRAYVEENFHKLFNQNKHFSLYLYPFTQTCQINTWNPTERPQSFLGPLREFLAISKDALLSAWFGGLMAVTGLLPRWSPWAYGFRRGTDLVLESYKGYNRTIYPLHEELEFTVPIAEAPEVCRKFLDLYERMYEEKKLPYMLVEVRFTPAGHDCTLLGAGRERASAWINLCCNDSGRFEEYYAEAEKLMREVGARPHLGKWCQSFDKNDLMRAHGEHFERFARLREEHDPEGKFLNAFTHRVFHGAPPAA